MTAIESPSHRVGHDAGASSVTVCSAKRHGGVCGHENAIDASRCAKCGTFLRGNPGHVTHGHYRYQRTDPPELVEQVQAFRAALILELGPTLTVLQRATIDQLVSLELDFRRLDTGQHRRTRPVMTLRQATIDRWGKVAQRLGLDVDARPSSPSTPAAWLASQRQTNGEQP